MKDANYVLLGIILMLCGAVVSVVLISINDNERISHYDAVCEMEDFDRWGFDPVLEMSVMEKDDKEFISCQKIVITNNTAQKIFGWFQSKGPRD